MEMDPLSIDNWDLLEPKVKNLWRIQAAISGVIFSIISLVVELAVYFNRSESSFAYRPGYITGGLLLLTVALPIYFAGRRYDMYRYRLGDSDLAVAHGIFWRTQRFINRARIQHVDISSGLISRALGLCEMSVFVGGQVGAAVQIPGLNNTRAEQIREVLLAGNAPRVDPPPVASPL
jgi:membrane protein YdbS with pleckstrin-like domain